MSDTDKGDLAVLFPEREVTLSTGEKLELKPFAFGKLPRAIRLLRPVTDAVRAAGIAGFDGTNFALAPDWPLRLPQLMDEGGEALVEFVGFAIGKPREWFDELGADDGIALTKAAFEVNGDFFARRVAPMLGMSIPRPAAATGEPSPADSAASATPGMTSNA
jgi:hypothetical protein